MLLNDVFCLEDGGDTRPELRVLDLVIQTCHQSVMCLIIPHVIQHSKVAHICAFMCSTQVYVSSLVFLVINTARVMIVNDHLHRTCVIIGTLHANAWSMLPDRRSGMPWLLCFRNYLLHTLPTFCGLDRISIGILSSDF